MKERPTLYVIDAYSFIFQVFHAIPLMAGPGGQPTNAVFGIFRDVLSLLKTRQPHSLAAAFDGGGRVFRSEMYADYKAQRKEMPEDLVPQIAVIKRLFEAFRIPVLMAPGFEADDIIATLATQAPAKGFDVFLCTADKDARQLLNEHVHIYNLRKAQVLDVAALEAEWGVKPEQVVDLLALTGDTVDNVPGVPGIGLKTGAELLRTFGDLDTLLDSIDKVSGAKRKENLKAHADTARRARALVDLRRDVPLDLDWDALKVDGYDSKALKALCVECGFHRFLDEIADEAAPEAPWDYSRYRTIDTPEALAELAETLRGLGKFALDTETTALDPLHADLVGISLAWEAGEAVYIPVRGPMFDRVLDETLVLKTLRPILENPAVEIVGQNLKYDLLVLRRAGVDLAPGWTDTMVLSYLLESGERNHNLDELSRRLLEHTMVPISALIGKGKGQKRMDEVEVARVTEYAGEDVDAAWRLEAILSEQVRKEGLWDLYADLERPLIGVLADMESVGIKVDVAMLRQLSEDFAARLAAIRSEIVALAGHEFNIGSAPQLRQVLFEELGLKSTKKTPKGEPSTDAEVLEELAPVHPLPRKIVQHRQLEKLKSTYLDALPEYAQKDGRVHTSFNQVVAATGRLSSSDPNLQNIPMRTEDGRQIRQAFVAGQPGWKLLTADYSQIELRILAHYSKDPRLVRAFAEDRDIHAVVASEIFGVKEAEVTPEQRRMAKTVNFGVIYGLSGYGLSTRLGISRSDADAFIEAYFKEYPGVAALITKTLETAKETGRVETILGRRRVVSGVKNTDRMKTQAERIAFNAVLQGSAADLIKRAMIAVDRRITERKMKARLLLQIHDELVLEAPDAEIPELSRMVRHEMTTAIPFDVPIQVDIAAGRNWLDVEDIDG
jgi:DNA polymerase-1